MFVNDLFFCCMFAQELKMKLSRINETAPRVFCLIYRLEMNLKAVVIAFETYDVETRVHKG